MSVPQLSYLDTTATKIVNLLIVLFQFLDAIKMLVAILAVDMSATALVMLKKSIKSGKIATTGVTDVMGA